MNCLFLGGRRNRSRGHPDEAEEVLVLSQVLGGVRYKPDHLGIDVPPVRCGRLAFAENTVEDFIHEVLCEHEVVVGVLVAVARGFVRPVCEDDGYGKVGCHRRLRRWGSPIGVW